MTTEAPIDVELVQALPGESRSLRLQLAAGTTVGEALRLAIEAGFEPAGVVDPGCLAVFGQAVTPATTLRAGDRLELLRPLLVDPKQQRRERAGRARR